MATFFHLIIIIITIIYVVMCCSVSAMSSSSSTNLPIASFHDAYSHLFGDANLKLLPHDAFSAHISLDQTTEWRDFEFLGNIRGKEWRVQTNVYGNGSTSRGREERYALWFDPSQHFHQYAILWTHNHIVFYVDDIPIREITRTEAMSGDFPSKPMSLYATIWDGSSWATSGGKYRVNYKYAPYTAQLSHFVLHGCAVDPIQLSPRSCENVPEMPSAVVAPQQRVKMANFRRQKMQYSYCYDSARYPVPLPECSFDPEEAEQLRRFDPVRFGGAHHHRGRRHRRS